MIFEITRTSKQAKQDNTCPLDGAGWATDRGAWVIDVDTLDAFLNIFKDETIQVSQMGSVLSVLICDGYAE